MLTLPAHRSPVPRRRSGHGRAPGRHSRRLSRCGRSSIGLQRGADEFPGAVQVFVGAPSDPGVVGAAHPWSAYGEAMRSVAAQDPRHRILVDLAPWFEPAGLGSGDPAGFVTADGVHPTDGGHAMLVLQALGYGC